MKSGDDLASTEQQKSRMHVEEVTGLVKKWHTVIGTNVITANFGRSVEQPMFALAA